MNDGWVKIGADHKCIPADWATYPRDSVFICPTCRKGYRVNGNIDGPSRSCSRDIDAELLALLVSPLALVFYATLAAVLVVAMLLGH